jgi:hypothetical protein
MAKPSDKVAKFNFSGMGHVHMHIDDYDKAMKNAAWVVRHSLQRNHGYSPAGCGGCRLIEEFLIDNPENASL